MEELFVLSVQAINIKVFDVCHFWIMTVSWSLLPGFDILYDFCMILIKLF